MGDQERAALIEAVERQLWRLDGTNLAAVALVSGLTIAELNDLGGLHD